MNEVFINGTRYETQADSVVINDAIEQRSVCSFVIIDTGNIYTFAKGMPISINNNLEWSNAYQAWGDMDDTWETTDNYFNGFIDKVIKRKQFNDVFYHYITCVDNNYLADKRIIAEAYANERVGDIVTDIYNNYLAEEGVTLGTIELGSIAVEAVFNYVSVTDAFNSLAEKSGFWWNISHNRVLTFKSKAENYSVFNINHDDIFILKNSVNVEESNPKYRNKQYVKGGKDITDAQTEIKNGDGEQQTFVVGYPIALVPTVEINVSGGGYVSQTIGIRGVDTDKNWYWAHGDNTITQDTAGTILTSSDKIKITYQGEFDVVVVSYDSDKIIDRQDAEGVGTGIVESVFEDQNLTTRESAFDVANAKLKKHSEITKIVTITTTNKFFEVGQITTINFPEYGINSEEFLITKINIFTEDRGQLVFYEIEAVKGQENDSWTRFFTDLLKQTEKFVIRENISQDQILVTLEEFTKDWYNVESPNIFRDVVASASTYPSATTYPMFKTIDQVKYIAWYVGGVEDGRKQITRRIDTASDIFTLSYLSPLDANVTISHIGWFGGTNATATTGTGVEIDKQVFVTTKTEFESIQIEKTDTNIDIPTATGTELTPEFLNNREQAIFNLRDYAETQMAIVVANSL